MDLIKQTNLINSKAFRAKLHLTKYFFDFKKMGSIQNLKSDFLLVPMKELFQKNL